ncbi:hybrid sensor histidine kinase/response regulator transcription factor [Winogradskyella flava]|uniref:hybrid sensor histidine kinase/response regulator transcription factor n=1 Tax=Winogradskyella flava TaxID=1884876 RepID=UPI002490B6C5|nr:two-component regulator propeller domain-containing protein [Winogradskyella flava]
MLRYSIIIAFLLYCSFGAAQEDKYQFKHISTSEGLSQSSVISIHQDNLGQMWIGTRDGLNKYDGTNFTIYRNEIGNPNSISNNDILSIVQDTDGFIWIGTYNGLNRYDPKKDVFTRYFHSEENSSLINNTIWTIEELSNGELWIGTSAGLSVYDKKTNSFHSFLKSEDPNSISGNYILSILQIKDGSVFIGTTSGLSKVVRDSSNTINFETLKGTENTYIQDLVESPDGTLLIGTRNESILEYDFDSKKLSNYFSQEQLVDKNLNVRQLLFDNDNKLWIGTYDGLQISYNKENLIVLKSQIIDSGSLSKNSVKYLFKDKKGSIWIGTYYGGLNIWDESNGNFKSVTQKSGQNGLSYSVISSIGSYKNLLFFGTEGGGINIYNRNDNQFSYLTKNSVPQLSNNNIKSLYLSEDNSLWVGTFDTGLQVLDVTNLHFSKSILSPELIVLLEDVGVYSITQDNDDNMWFGTFGKGLVKYHLVSKMIETYQYNPKSEKTISSDLVRTVVVDSKDNIWTGTQRGLNKISPNGDITNYFYDNKIQSGDDILSVYEDENKTIWVGTKARGLFKLAPTGFEHVNLRDNNQNISTIHSILEDDDGNLWIATNQGLAKYNIQKKTQFVYNQKEGLISNEFNDNACLKIGNSSFYFGGPVGITFFNSKEITTNDYAPQVIIASFKIKNKSIGINDDNSILQNTIPFTKGLKLNYDQGNFSVDFTIPNFINSSKNKYKYHLKGLEEEWIETTENSASYTIQNAGDYIFEVKGANSDGIWNENSTQIRIEVAPAPWRSWWAFLIYGLLILGALYFLVNILKSRTKLQTELELEHREVERTKEINKAKLEFFTNVSHEFRTPLTLILGPLHQILEEYKGSSKMYKKLLVIESSAKHLLQLINRLMDFRKFENNLYKLEAAEGNIVKFLREIYLSFAEYAKDGNYEYDFHTSDDEILVYYDRYKLERVFYNLISNAFRYTPQGGKITLRIRKENDAIDIKVEDSGVGISQENRDKIFERFYEMALNKNPDSNYNRGTGIGLSITKNIVGLHKGEISVRDNEDGAGSVFSVKLPLGHEHLSDGEIIKDFRFSDDVSQYVKQLDIKQPEPEDQWIEELPSKDKATILLVEDHKPLRKFMRDILKHKYNILEAENGKVALKIAQKESPDLIVSDVIMPVMVGTELCATIKENIRTSHIPVILLTSRTALIYRIEGLRSGADDYISKPFDVNEFKIRIKNLLESTSRLKNKFASEDPLLPNEIIVSSLDEKLYKKALQIVENNIGNEQFDIPYFCSELGVSRTMLFVKIKAWTNFTPNEFIQHFRMKRAAQLLEQGKINISEVSYKVGFRNPKYFSKCFQKKYGVTPSKYSSRFSTDF